MPYNNHAAAFFLIALILLATANPLAHGINLNLGGIRVSGRICCMPTRNCPGQGVRGVVVSLNCTRLGGALVVVGRNTTDAQGRFNITVRNVLGLVPSLTTLPCFATVQLPLNQTLCPVLNTTRGTLVGIVQPLGFLITD